MHLSRLGFWLGREHAMTAVHIRDTAIITGAESDSSARGLDENGNKKEVDR